VAGAVWLVTGSLLYLAGTIAVTRIVHLPRNAALMGIDPDNPESEGWWRRYVSEWTAWNHVRTAAALAAAACLTISLL
jgi:uncharacterized membrane protein